MADQIAEEVAQAEFLRMCELNFVDTDEAKMSPQEKAEFDVLRGRIVSAMRSGALVVDQAGRPTYQPVTPNQKPVTFREVTGETFLALEGPGGGIHRIVRGVQQLTGTTSGVFSKYLARDFKVVCALGNLFLAQE